MESVFNLNITEIVALALVFLRMIGFVVAMPVFGTVNVATPVKVLLALALTFILFPQVGWRQIDANPESLELISMAVQEVFIGLAFGYLARMFFMAVAIAGQIMSVSLGLSAAQLFNPTMGESSTAFDQFYVTLASLFFLGVGGHHILISGIFESYQLVPMAKDTISLGGMRDIAPMVQTVMEIGLKLAAPILMSVLFMNMAVAVIGRAVPQINILITSLPVNVMAGLFVTLVTLPLLLWQMDGILEGMVTRLLEMTKSF